MSLRKIYILTILLCSVWSVSRANAQSLAEQAGMAYQKGDYAKAVELYEQSGEQDGTSAAYFYNLGNAYYKCGRYPDAILNYERSLLLDSDNADTRFNLEMAQARIADKIEPLGTFFLVQWSTAVRNLFPSNVWAVIAVVAFLLFLVGVVLYFFVEKVVLRKIGFFAGCDRCQSFCFGAEGTDYSSRFGDNFCSYHYGEKFSVGERYRPFCFA